MAESHKREDPGAGFGVYKIALALILGFWGVPPQPPLLRRIQLKRALIVF